MLVVAGLALRQLHPRVWDKSSSYYLPNLKAVMVSYADFYRVPLHRRRAMEMGLHEFLGIPEAVKIYLDNGSFYFMKRDGEVPRDEYEAFVEKAKPDWYPIPQEYIPVPKMTPDEQQLCYAKTMKMNRTYSYDGYTPVIHVGRFLEKYTKAIASNAKLSSKTKVALGAIVPNLLRSPKALKHEEIIDDLLHVRDRFSDKELHVFGIGGTATLHIAALLGIDSVDSSGWRNRAARGIIQLPGKGDRIVAELGKWRGREPSKYEWQLLKLCKCPACQNDGIRGLKADKVAGFKHRACHNLWVLLEEAEMLQSHITNRTYSEWYKSHLDNPIYKPLIDRIVKRQANETF